jgi:enterochelin esterase-like enzyme
MATSILRETLHMDSRALNRKVIVDLYRPTPLLHASDASLLLINDGQDMETMKFTDILRELSSNQQLRPLIAVGVHAGTERKMEYGVAGVPDFKQRGAMALEYTSFILTELVPFLKKRFRVEQFRDMNFAGFSLGGLSAIDIVWSHPHFFRKVGVFSGSLWWRSVDQFDEVYNDDLHRIIHQRIRLGHYQPGLKFFFQCGNLVETKDRNNNGVIDSIDDTLDLISELKAKGYHDDDIYYLEFPDGKHDVPTWGRGMPVFLKWAFGN